MEDRRESFTPIKHLAFSIAVHDVAAFHVILSAAANDLERLNKITSATQGMAHKMVVLRLLNERLANTTLATKDGTIAAVVLFAGLEVRGT